MNLATEYGMKHGPQAMSLIRSRGVAHDDVEDVYQVALLRCFARGANLVNRCGQDDCQRCASRYWYLALESLCMDYNRQRKRRTLSLTDEIANSLPAPLRPALRSLNGFGSSRVELEAVYEFISRHPARRRAVGQHLRSEPLTAREARHIDDLRQRLEVVRASDV